MRHPSSLSLSLHLCLILLLDFGRWLLREQDGEFRRVVEEERKRARETATTLSSSSWSLLSSRFDVVDTTRRRHDNFPSWPFPRVEMELGQPEEAFFGPRHRKGPGTKRRGREN